MGERSIWLLGPPRASLAGQPVASFRYDKVLALLAYLAVEGGRPQRRELLAGLLWPEQPERSARRSLSQALFTLRAVLEGADARAPWLLASLAAVQIDPAAGVWSDVAEHGRLLAARQAHCPPPVPPCPACIEHLGQATSLHHGPFLAGFSLPDSPTFDEWAAQTRERLRREALAALDELADHAEAAGDRASAAAHLRRLLELEPLSEAGHRRLIRTLAAGGDRAAALAAYERCRQILQAELGVEPEAETLALADSIRDGTQLSPEAPTARARGKLPTLRALPAQPTPLIGREQELAALAALVADSSCRLVTLVGPGGIGKTRLALAAAEAASTGQPAAFVALAGLPPSSPIAPSVLTALGLTFYGQADPQEQLIAHLREARLLLVLDNLEQLPGAAPLVAAILAAAPGVRVLATARERLGLHAEHSFEVGGLSLAGKEAELIGPAEQLFAQRARHAQPRRAVGPDDWPAITRICRLVGGMPLGIELAAGWCAVLSCAEIAAELTRGLDLLATTTRDIPERHRSIRAAFDQSWQLLEPRERAAFARLSVFRGGFTRAAARAVAGADLHTLRALTEKSLLQVADGRYQLHELLRQYGEERLGADLAADVAARAQHCAFTLGELAACEPRLEGAEQRRALAEIAADLENVRAAWHYAARSGQSELLSQSAHAFWLFSEMSGRYHECAATFAAALPDLEAAAAAPGAPPAQRLALARALLYAGSFAIRFGRPGEVEAASRRGIELLRPLGADRELALGLNFLACAHHMRGDYPGEQRVLEESIARARAAGYRWLLGYSLNDLGMALHLCGDTVAAQQCSAESLATFRDLGDTRGMAFTLTNLGIFAAHLGEHESAWWFFDEGLELWRATGHQWGIAVTLTHLGAVARARGDGLRAREHLLQALQTAVAIRATPAVLDALIGLAELAASAGDAAQAGAMLSVVRGHPALSPHGHVHVQRLLSAAGPVASTGRGALDDLVRALLDG